MNQKIAELLRLEIVSLSFVELTAGLVRSLPIKVPTTDGGVIIKNIPIAFNTEVPCEGNEDQIALVPDSSKKSIIFFEDGGIQITGTDTRYTHCESLLTMVAWFNLPMINIDYADATLLMAALINEIPKYIANSDFITRIMITPVGFLQKDTVYSQYDLDLAENQYFSYPYDYGAYQFNIKFSIPKSALCFDEIEIDPKCI